MSYGTLCLLCRKYVGEGKWCCRCENPVPSDDGVRPNTDGAKATPEPPK